ncbi:hypothetical protein GCM10010293_31530 [Streptomyces griseoflavus]|nr:hypothetical protein GCM10010293_31530 [Streptomyces griseoflavus]
MNTVRPFSSEGRWALVAPGAEPGPGETILPRVRTGTAGFILALLRGGRAPRFRRSPDRRPPSDAFPALPGRRRAGTVSSAGTA